MANMSYCRFENTSRDLQDCYENFTSTRLSEDEKRYRARIVEQCLLILEECCEGVEISYETGPDGKVTVMEYDDDE
jgi:hypothetical protein